jgi:hypothetical protein
MVYRAPSPENVATLSPWSASVSWTRPGAEKIVRIGRVIVVKGDDSLAVQRLEHVDSPGGFK